MRRKQVRLPTLKIGKTGKGAPGGKSEEIRLSASCTDDLLSAAATHFHDKDL